MDKELQQYYEDRFTMFTTKGWKDLLVDIEKIKSSIKVEDIPDEKTLFARRGELRIMNWILTLKDVSEQTYKDLDNEDTV
jgi:hypothetical protein|tara:strand:- start:2150 stop:2389 length:240 start_codon:yes stop_codon:yes gene_type:complete